jgi:methionyl aminopeptidase
MHSFKQFSKIGAFKPRSNLTAYFASRSNHVLSNLRTAEPLQKGVVSPKLHVPLNIPYPEYAMNGRPKQSGDSVVFYSPEEYPKIRKAARLARKILEFSLAVAKPGMTTNEIDVLAHNEILKHGAYPSPLNYCGFPKSICTSVNEVVCHGIPDSRVLKEGDILSIDVSVYLDGYHGDNCGTIVVGKKVDPQLLHMIDATKEAVQRAIAVCKPGV